MVKLFLKTIRGKVIVLACLISFFTATIIGIIYFQSMKKMALNKAISSLAGDTRLIAEEFEGMINAIRNDLEVVSKTPPVTGIIRSLESGVDPMDQSTYEEWRKRLEMIFRSVMSLHPKYTQMSYVGVGGGGREIVRVNRINEELQFVAEENLQQKGKRRYFLEGLTKRTEEIYFTDLEYNIENGQNIIPKEATLRAVKPIFEENQLFGFLMINLDYQTLLNKGFKVFDSDKHILVSNQNGDFMEFDPNAGTTSFEFHQNYSKTPPYYITKFNQSSLVESLYYEGSDVIYFVKKYLPGTEKSKFISVAFKVPESELLKEAYQAAFNSLLAGFFLVLFSTVATAFIARRFTRPWEELTEDVLKIEDFTKPVEFDTDSQDEVGKLAEAFQELANNLMANKSKSKLILDNILDGVVIIDEHGVIGENNPAFEKIFGLQQNEGVGRKLDLFIPDHILEVTHRRDLEGVNVEGVKFPIELSITKMMFENNQLYIGIIRDITERKKFERKLIQANKEYETLTYITSHDLRSPLINLKGFSTELENYIREIQPYIKNREKKIDEKESKKLNEIMNELLPEAIRFIQQGVDRIDSMTKAMLNLSRTGRRELQFKEICTEKLVRKCRDIFSHQISDKKIEVLIHPLPDIVGDPLAVEQIFSNLFDNSIKYSSPEKKGLIEISGKEYIDHYEFSFSDNGMGIEPSEADKVFAVFRRTSNALGVVGEGMGLSYVKTLIQRHEGEIHFQSEVDKGTTFFFTFGKLPVRVEDG